jgi:hypothetical protein
MMEGTSYILMKYDDNDVCFVLDQHAELGWLTETTVCG